jgi:EXPERA (EXPanded EBP superfamily)
MRALKGATRTAFLGFFSSHIFFTLIIDLQALLPPAVFPKAMQDFLVWYATTLKDPIMSDPQSLLWFQSLIFCEMFFQLPFFFVACYFLRSSDAVATDYPDWFRTACIAYGAHTATTLARKLHPVGTSHHCFRLSPIPHIPFVDSEDCRDRQQRTAHQEEESQIIYV